MKFPGEAFFLFGAGERRKLLYKAGVLYDVLNGDVLRQWDRASGRIELVSDASHPLVKTILDTALNCHIESTTSQQPSTINYDPEMRFHARRLYGF